MNFKIDDVDFFKDKIDTSKHEENIYNQFAKNMAKAQDIDLAKTPLVDLITGYIECKTFEFYAMQQQSKIDKTIEILKQNKELAKEVENGYAEEICDKGINILEGKDENI